MTEPLLAFALLGAISAISIGAARIVSWYLDRRGEPARRSAREAAFEAEARAELAATGWTAEEEAAFQAVRSQQGKHLRALRPEFRQLIEETHRA
ncbi:hypothetical protein [Stenotrophomonas maltophilia]|uniref:hypothetical protein n=1 Tax=Stenotrophomonas maltophilia group TaxID=995085 RepID=UPI00070B127F|nr:hypothetical protein [Stenotrophomonas maltophilia]KRG53391.1 hypothetical protein ARC02_12325 [Stenotrophomonas maltophilia]NNH47889.1 hypothetical protein [Stenotrophomonas maltophilia]VEE51533.1 Uncharacterised protein [Stenotrophomonas maltophilia]